MSLIRFNCCTFLAALSMYTRLPAWRLMTLEREHYAAAIRFLPLVGAFTGGLMAVVFWGTNALLGLSVLTSAILALASRLILTGAFHEDGLGDFFDGFGGGRDKDAVLRIMKDSHTGSYAIVGYIFYYALYFSLIVSLPIEHIPLVLLSADMLGKNLNQLQTAFLSYARNAEESKTKIIYKPISPLSFISLPIVAMIMFNLIPWYYLLIPILVSLSTIAYIRKRIGGYTGDTCGALILLTELAALFAFNLYWA